MQGNQTQHSKPKENDVEKEKEKENDNDNDVDDENDNDNDNERIVHDSLTNRPPHQQQQRKREIKMKVDIFNTDKKYNIIYADPPWRYDFSKSNNRKIENQYPTMTVDEICNLPIPTSKNAVLYLWATAPKLLEALKVMKAWGFEYKTNAVWDKDAIGMGFWFRGQHELLLVGVKGKFSPPTVEHRVSSVFREKKTKHSKKPIWYLDYLSKTFPQSEKIELFARQHADGWDCWGNEV